MTASVYSTYLGKTYVTERICYVVPVYLFQGQRNTNATKTCFFVNKKGLIDKKLFVLIVYIYIEYMRKDFTFTTIQKSKL